jgi:hypothetical protein
MRMVPSGHTRGSVSQQRKTHNDFVKIVMSA